MFEPVAARHLVQALRADQRQRWGAGQLVPAEAYLAGHPAVAADPDCALELVYNEVVLREERGDAPRLEEYVGRFPQLGARLAPLFEVHRALESGELFDGLGSGPAAGPPSFAPAGYELLEEVGRGGMGVVYRAWQRSLNRPVAVKLILAGRLATPDEVRRFRTEAEAAAQLGHPHIVPIHEVGEHAGRPFFSMRFVEGGSLAGWLAARPAADRRASWAPAVKILAAVARAVYHAHRRGLLHRDLKPSNILLDAEGQPYVTDFGLAKRLARPGAPASGTVVGTAGYMAPEQADPRRPLTAAVDVYSLGAILYEVLTGRPPFQADTPLHTLLELVAREPPPPRAWDPAVDRGLETVCLKCLRREPHERYPSAAALADDLDHWLVGKPVQARPPTHLQRWRRWCRHNAGRAGMAVALALLLAGLVWSALRAAP